MLIENKKTASPRHPRERRGASEHCEHLCGGLTQSESSSPNIDGGIQLSLHY